jgi:hypothetical protein
VGYNFVLDAAGDNRKDQYVSRPNHPVDALEDAVIASAELDSDVSGHLDTCSGCRRYFRDFQKAFHLIAYVASISLSLLIGLSRGLRTPI